MSKVDANNVIPYAVLSKCLDIMQSLSCLTTEFWCHRLYVASKQMIMRDKKPELHGLHWHLLLYYPKIRIETKKWTPEDPLFSQWPCHDCTVSVATTSLRPWPFFWTPYRLVHWYYRFGGARCFHFQGTFFCSCAALNMEAAISVKRCYMNNNLHSDIP
jgi:hypothetical protein